MCYARPSDVNIASVTAESTVMTLIPPEFLDSVTAIGADDSAGKRNWIGTGFLFAQHVHEDQYTPFLVTNRHVLNGQKIIYLKFNSATDTSSIDYPIDLSTVTWVDHPDNDIDVAVFPINLVH